MWESDIEAQEGSEFNEEALRIGVRKTSIFLKSIVTTNINHLPLPILTAWQMKRTQMRGFETTEEKLVCPHCGLSFRSKRTFSLKIKISSGRRILQGKCNGCDTPIHVGKMRDLKTEDFDNTFHDRTRNEIMNESFIKNISPMLASTPLPKSPMKTPGNTSKTKSFPKTPGNNTVVLPNLSTTKSKKKKGSALARLLQEEESESDRSLNSFLSSFSQ